MPDIRIAQLVDRFLRRIHAGLHAKAGDFDTDRVGPGGGLILMTLADIEPAPIHTLVRLMARDKSQMTRAIKALEDKGLLARAQSSHDARVCLLQLTPKGHSTVARMQGAIAEVIDGILMPLEPEDRTQLRRLLSKALPEDR